MVKKLMRSAALGMVVLSLLAPAAAQAQAKPPAKKVVNPVNEQRWASMIESMSILAQEGNEVKRIDVKEKQQIDAWIAAAKKKIADVKQGGITEAEEDAIDDGIANEMVRIAQFFSDAQRKAANPVKPAAKK